MCVRVCVSIRSHFPHEAANRTNSIPQKASHLRMGDSYANTYLPLAKNLLKENCVVLEPPYECVCFGWNGLLFDHFVGAVKLLLPTSYRMGRCGGGNGPIGTRVRIVSMEIH